METSRRARRQGPLLNPEVLDSLSACAPRETDEVTRQRLQLLSGCLAKLPPEVRRAVELRYQPAHQTAGVARLPADRLTGFFIAGSDRKWAAADALIDGDGVVVSSPAVPHPVAVRYGWANSPQANL